MNAVCLLALSFLVGGAAGAVAAIRGGTAAGSRRDALGGSWRRRAGVVMFFQH